MNLSNMISASKIISPKKEIFGTQKCQQNMGHGWHKLKHIIGDVMKQRHFRDSPSKYYVLIRVLNRGYALSIS